MVHDPHVAGHDLVLEDGAGGDVDPLPVVGDDDHRALQTHLDTVILEFLSNVTSTYRAWVN